MEFYVDTIALKKKMLDEGITTNLMLARESGVDRNTIGAIVSGKVKPSVAAIEKIAVALDMSGADIGDIFFKQKLA